MRYALKIEYEGTCYFGFQRQFNPDLPTIQDKLETAISKIANHAVTIVAAGRTDAGVHATHQVIHFDSDAVRASHNWLMGINTELPGDIAVAAIQPVSSEFHARFSAVLRSYEYRILNVSARSALKANRVMHYYLGKLDEHKMQEASYCLLGEHDFSSFRAAQCQSKTPFRRIVSLTVGRENNEIIIAIQANAFLHHMVRNIVGVLVDIGSGKKPVDYAEKVLLAKNRTLSSPTAVSSGLYLNQVIYPESFGLKF